MIDQKTINRVQVSLSQGETKEAIYQALLSEGQSLESIKQAFALATREDKKEQAQKRVIRIVVVIGAVLIGAGIFSFIAANWQEMGKWLKVAIIVASMIASYSAGWYLREKRGLIKTGAALILLGAIIYGAGIFLVAQIFHIRANWPDGFILWMIGVILMAFVIDVLSLFALAIPLGIIAVIAHPFDIFTSSIADSFLLTSSFLLLAAAVITFISGVLIHKRISERFKDLFSQFFFLLSIVFLSATLLAFNRDFSDPVSWRVILYITSITGLIIAYYYKSTLALTAGLIGIIGWWGAQIADWAMNKDIGMSSIFVGLMLISLILYVLGHLHEIREKYKRFARVYLIFGIIAITGVLFFLSTQSGLGFLDGLSGDVEFYGEWRISISLILFAVALIGLLSYTVNRKLISRYQAMAVILLAILFCSILFIGGADLFVKKRQLTSTGAFWAIVYNIVIFFEILGLIFAGYIRREKGLINLGAIFLFLLILVKYFDWFFGSIDKGIFFIGAGILLFVVGWFMEKGRRKIISGI